MASLPISINLADNKIRIPVNFQKFDAHVDRRFNAINASLIFGHVVSSIETNMSRERNVVPLRGSDNSSDTVAHGIGGNIKNKRTT